ncbi:hypothetical protein DL96DRAFT_1586848 [Flagelloscypha sp. PMI_526]|nr:hypothetical protein DL96DRAFT_1586848 [Flagelloscypha sp. PMI_526]
MQFSGAAWLLLTFVAFLSGVSADSAEDRVEASRKALEYFVPHFQSSNGSFDGFNYVQSAGILRSMALHDQFSHKTDFRDIVQPGLTAAWTQGLNFVGPPNSKPRVYYQSMWALASLAASQAYQNVTFIEYAKSVWDILNIRNVVSLHSNPVVLQQQTANIKRSCDLVDVVFPTYGAVLPEIDNSEWAYPVDTSYYALLSANLAALTGSSSPDQYLNATSSSLEFIRDAMLKPDTGLVTNGVNIIDCVISEQPYNRKLASSAFLSTLSLLANVTRNDTTFMNLQPTLWALTGSKDYHTDDGVLKFTAANDSAQNGFMLENIFMAGQYRPGNPNFQGQVKDYINLQYKALTTKAVRSDASDEYKDDLSGAQLVNANEGQIQAVAILNAGMILASSDDSSQGNNSSSESSSPSRSKSSPPIGAIVGGVVGGVALIAALVALFFCRRKRRSPPRRRNAALPEPKEDHAIPTPFLSTNSHPALSALQDEGDDATIFHLESSSGRGSRSEGVLEPQRRGPTKQRTMTSSSLDGGTRLSQAQSGASVSTPNVESIPSEELMRILASRGHVVEEVAPPAYN